ncbi:uncharacterized protein SETTUDRAFT_22367 [Exserohilum turcica Et28A]|uniref:Uncharacterized protein n=1 Tax=Exserohilum turcicum (strain 28A) TaxID=671987 RepID=R0IA73_EXST2|nr:uncharacterized protein SETTUDRAFT_22367 [Exserohilum turcica Et28A]EOA82370.1 hypothetical protein SETTUDRAFT_22367 [Exserohilum turcica Et28A]
MAGKDTNICIRERVANHLALKQMTPPTSALFRRRGQKQHAGGLCRSTLVVVMPKERPDANRPSV